GDRRRQEHEQQRHRVEEAAHARFLVQEQPGEEEHPARDDGERADDDVSDRRIEIRAYFAPGYDEGRVHDLPSSPVVRLRKTSSRLADSRASSSRGQRLSTAARKIGLRRSLTPRASIAKAWEPSSPEIASQCVTPARLASRSRM